MDIYFTPLAQERLDDIVEYLVGYEIVDEKSDNVDQEYIVNYRMRYASDEAHGAIHSLQLTFDSNTRILKRWSIRA